MPMWLRVHRDVHQRDETMMTALPYTVKCDTCEMTGDVMILRYKHVWDGSRYIYDKSGSVDLGWSTGPQCKTLAGAKRSLSVSRKSGGYPSSAQFTITVEEWIGGCDDRMVCQAHVKE